MHWHWPILICHCTRVRVWTDTLLQHHVRTTTTTTTTTKHTRFFGVRCRLFCVALFGTFMWSQVRGEHVSAARRRRERRLRQFLRHERLSVAMPLAESQHHTAPRGQKMARAGGVEREENYEPWLLDPPLQGAATLRGCRRAFACYAAACGGGRLGLRHSRLPHGPCAPGREEGDGEEGGRGGKAGGAGLAAQAPEAGDVEIGGAGGAGGGGGGG